MKKTNNIFKLTMLMALMLISVYSKAIPAFPGLINFQQPNGDKIEIYLNGDEKISWATTLDGFSLMFNKTGFYEYAVLNSEGDMCTSGIIAKQIEERTTEVNLFLQKVKKGIHYSTSQISMIHQIWNIREKESTKAFPTTGARKLVCILIGFQDKTFTKTKADFESLFNQLDYSAGSATGSVKDFFLEASYNQLDLTVTVAGPYVAANNMSYYGANSGENHSINADELVIEALNFANPTINYADFDNDNNGSIDAVYIIFAGYGEEAGASTNAIWSHKGGIPTQTLDGKTIDNYACSPELRSNYGSNITRIGVICHEFGHTLGAPDFYDVDYEVGGSFIGTGMWDLQADGSWNNGGTTPPHPNAYTKCYIYNWATPTILSAGTNITLLNSTENSDHFYRYNTKTNNEFYLIENKQKIGFDTYVPGHGLLIYHVHSAVGNTPNATYPQKMYPVCASATTNPGTTPSTYGSINTGGCTFPGTGVKTKFTDITTPWSKSWAGVNTLKPITNITENTTNKTISLYFNYEDIQSFVAEPVSFSQINLTWTKNLLDNNVIIAYSTNSTFGTPVNGLTYSAGSTIPGGGTVIYAGDLLNFSHNGLTSNTAYYYKAWSILSGTIYSIGNTINTKTLCDVFTTFPFIEDFEGTTLPDCWTSFIGTNALGTGQNWKITSSSYTGAKAAFVQPEDVAGGLSEDWMVSPAIVMSNNSGYQLSYFEKQAYTDNKNSTFQIKVSETSQTNIETFTTIESYDETSFSNTYTPHTIDLSAYAGKTIYVAFVFTQDAGDVWYIDDISINKTSATDKISKDQKLFVYPNPNNGSFSLNLSESDSNYYIEVTNISGIVVYTQNYNKGENKISMPSNLKGIYYMKIKFIDHIEVLKLIIK